MLLKSKLFHAFFAIALLFLVSAVSFADTVRLKDGSIVKGRVIGFKDGYFIIQIGEGSRLRTMNYFADEVATIDFDNPGMGSTNTAVVTNTSSSNNTQPAPNYSGNTNNTTPVPSSTPYPPNVRVIGVPVSNPANQSSTNTSQAIPPTATPTTSSQPVTSVGSSDAVKLATTQVLADNSNNGWTTTGYIVKKGQRIRITATGRIALGGGRYAPPSGVASLPDPKKLMKDRPTGGLIAVLGDDNNDFIFVGNAVEFTATREGALFLGVNEDYLDDNSGSFTAIVEIIPN